MATQRTQIIDRISMTDALKLAADHGLTVVTEAHHMGHQTYRYTRIRLGSVTIAPFEEPRWRDLGEGPSWQEKYTVTMPLSVPVEWTPGDGHNGLRICYPVVSLIREGGAKWGGVSVAVRDETTPEPSQQISSTYEYDGFQQIGTKGTLFGFRFRWAGLRMGVTEIPYDHDPSRTHWVLTADRW